MALETDVPPHAYAIATARRFAASALVAIGCSTSPPADGSSTGTEGEASDAADVDTGSDSMSPEDSGADDPTGGGAADDSTGEIPPEPRPWIFEVWAPEVDGVDVVFDDPSLEPIALADEGDGRWFASLDEDALPAAAEYRLVVHDEGGTLDRLDPRALGLRSDGQRSILLPPSLAWPATESEFERPARDASIVYELHIGSFHRKNDAAGTFSTAIERLDYLAELGINVIELMPVHEFPGDSSWGYNPRFPYVVEQAYGGAAGLQEFVAEAHARDIAVVLDVVYNHLDGTNVLCNLTAEADGCDGPYFADTPTAWGPRPDFEREGVREYFVDNAQLWVDTFHIDGFRWDSTSNIWATDNGGGPLLAGGREFLREANRRIDEWGPNYLNIAEDFNGGEFVTRPVADDGLGFDSQWDGGFHWAMTAALVNGNPNLGEVSNSLRWQYGGDAFARVIYTENHDTTGFFNDHVRLPQQLDPAAPDSLGARKRATLALGLTLTAPGIPMLLQGQEFVQPGSFHDSHGLDWDLAGQNSGIVEAVRDLVALRRNLAGTTGGLRGPNLEVIHVNQGAGVIAYRRSNAGGPGDDVIVVVNFGTQPFPSYRIGMPAAGKWIVRFNGDSNSYAPDFGNVGGTETTTESVDQDGFGQSAILGVGALSLVVLSQD